MMNRAAFVYIWEYRVDESERQPFLAACQPGGDWARLFGIDPHYHGTTLLQDANDDGRFITIDYWTSRAHRDAFRSRHAAEFEALDRRCELYTRHEIFFGDFIDIAAISREPGKEQT